MITYHTRITRLDFEPLTPKNSGFSDLCFSFISDQTLYDSRRGAINLFKETYKDKIKDCLIRTISVIEENKH